MRRHYWVLIRVTSLLMILVISSSVIGSAYVGGGVLNSWTDVNNWGGGDFTGGAGIVPSQAGNVGSAFGDIDFTFGEAAPVDSLYLVVGSSAGNTFTMASGQLTYTGDGLIGTTLSVATGAATIVHTGGTLIQTGGGAGFLVGHNSAANYSISGGSVMVQSGAPTLTIDFPDGGAASSLNISGTGTVDVDTDLVINVNGTLNVTDDGVLIWRNHVVADVGGANFGGTINATISQVGNDVHFTVIPEPSTLVMFGLGLAFFGLRINRRS